MDEELHRTLLLPSSSASLDSCVLRSYQLEMLRSSLYHNTLIVLPTGLGKTLIASSLLINLHRWFPESILVFVAPTRPLVDQQWQSCCLESSNNSNRLLLPEDHTACMT
ncbi:MAG: hypothetical protein MHPSP_002381, partial [Paramarteilia canceri]